MTSTNVFEADQTTDANPSNVDVITPTPEAPAFVSELVGEGKKFKSIDDLAKGKLEADTYIEHLKKEMAELRSDLESKATTEEILKSLKTKEDTNPEIDNAHKAAIQRPEDIANIVREQISQSKAEEIAQANVTQANDTLIAKLGDRDKAVKFIADKSKELGLPAKRLMEIAAESPTALYEVLGFGSSLKQDAPIATSVASSVNTTVIPDSTVLKPGTKEYYDKMRRENKTAYFSTKVQNEILQHTKAGTYKP